MLFSYVNKQVPYSPLPIWLYLKKLNTYECLLGFKFVDSGKEPSVLAKGKMCTVYASPSLKKKLQPLLREGLKIRRIWEQLDIANLTCEVFKHCFIEI